ncbi:hypothetical protein [Phaeobacter inhibens]|uniref:hypothetical protein n=1 Tax=Phaeobacter inhibens TaxID=221822 RepID=UPI000C9A1FEC|nr:hypothetical protein [Phaeobacter inhibens]AUQ62150.1 hypothetical protein PhaeoP51_01152 [Phaeobacter inhibens]AUQ89861.1 hypothetical protein PhaeoP24_01233 [Phaeobacter inhibens]
MQKAASLAGCFAAAAYEAAPSGGADVHALTRSFLLALIDPTDPALDYLRADPAAGAAARDSAAQITKITHPQNRLEEPMQITATISQRELERMVSNALKAESPNAFPHGARVFFSATRGQLDQLIISASATPANPVQPKD